MTLKKLSGICGLLLVPFPQSPLDLLKHVRHAVHRREEFTAAGEIRRRFTLKDEA